MNFFSSLAQAPALHFWLFTAIGCAAAGSAFVRIWRNYFYYRLIHDTPQSRLRSASQGYVELQGSSWCLPQNPVVSPLTGLPCVWWSYQIDKQVRGEKHTRWKRVESGESAALFQLVDGDVSCLINPADAVVSSRQKDVWRGSARRPLPRAVRVGGGWHFPTDRLGFGGKYRYTEILLLRDAQLYALGDLSTRRPAEDFDAEAELRRILVLWKQDQHALLDRFDKDRNDRIDQDEWEDARRAALTEVDEELIRLRAEPSVNMLRSPSDTRPLLLSDSDPETTARKHLRRAQMSLLLFLVGTGLLATLIFQRLALTSLG